jgi:hypothetical protein
MARLKPCPTNIGDTTADSNGSRFEGRRYNGKGNRKPYWS